jgi:hypothetical protein
MSNQNQYFECIDVVLETFPRSGTHFIMNNLIKNKNFGCSTIYKNELQYKSEFPAGFEYYNSIYFSLPKKRNYILKTHLFKTLENSTCFKQNYFRLNLVSYPLDAVYSWGHMSHSTHHKGTKKKYIDYILYWDSPEWHQIIKLIPVLVQRLRDCSTIFRYEDLATTENKSTIFLTKTLGLNKIENFNPNKKRIFYSHDFSNRFDDKVLDYLINIFSYFIKNFYPNLRP